MKVFRMRLDVDHYQFVVQERPEDARRLRMDGTSIAHAWTPPPVYILYPRYIAGGFYQPNNSIAVTDPPATEALRSHLVWAGELLPLPCGDQIFTLLNVTQCINVLDRERSEIIYAASTGVPMRATRFAFHANRFVETSLFKIPEFNGNEVFVLEGANDFEMEFREAVEAAGIKGLIFTELWNDEE